VKFVIAVVIIVGLSRARGKSTIIGELPKSRRPLPPRPLPRSTATNCPACQPGWSRCWKRRGSGATGCMISENNGKMVEDPRLAWIQLDYVLLVAPMIRGSPQVFAKVKSAFRQTRPSITDETVGENYE